MKVKAVMGVAGACVALAGVAVTAQGSPADASAVHRGWHAARVLGHTLRYGPAGIQLQCRRAQRAELAVMTGDGPAFIVQCRKDGPFFVWDVVR